MLCGKNRLAADKRSHYTVCVSCYITRIAHSKTKHEKKETFPTNKTGNR